VNDGSTDSFQLIDLATKAHQPTLPSWLRETVAYLLLLTLVIPFLLRLGSCRGASEDLVCGRKGILFVD